MVGTTRRGLLRGARGTKQTPSGNTSSSSVATCTPRRVLPMPPMPVSVTSRTHDLRSNAQTVVTCRSRPINEVSCPGKLLNWISGVLDSWISAKATPPPHGHFFALQALCLASNMSIHLGSFPDEIHGPGRLHF